MKQCVYVILCGCALASCAAPQEEFNTQFDGDWRAQMRDTVAVQQVQDVRFDCAPFVEPFFIRVSDGIASGFLEINENFSFSVPVDSRGQFKAIIPTNSVYSYKEAQVGRESNIVLVLAGSLSNNRKSGYFVIGDEAIDGQGCKTRVQFESI